MHLMGLALENLRQKGHQISRDEETAARLAILLHDIGHGPFSHALENSILQDVHHEKMSLVFIDRLNFLLGGKLDMARAMFLGQYPRPFFNQLISGQLDIDRIDYLRRDCFFSGVAEGAISAERILSMLEVHQDRLVVEEKAIYSIENFLSSRRLMYWQVYLHKTTVSAEEMLIQLMRRARVLIAGGARLSMTAALEPFFLRNFGWQDFISDPAHLNAFSLIDDYDIWYCIKSWVSSPDFVLAYLSRGLMERRLLKVAISARPSGEYYLQQLRENFQANLGISAVEATYLVFEKEVSNSAYISGGNQIFIKTRKGEIMDVANATDLPNIHAMATEVKKYIVCQPKPISLHPFAEK
jgi:HD superfamily phosphohydrolase